MTRIMIEDLPVLEVLSKIESKGIIGGSDSTTTRDDETDGTLSDETEEARAAKKTYDGLMCWSDEVC